MHIYKVGLRNVCLADCGEDGNRAYEAPETAAGMRPQLGKEGRKTVPNSGAGYVCEYLDRWCFHLRSLLPSSLPTAPEEQPLLLGEAN